MKNIYQQISDYPTIKPVLATVISTDGSTPQKPGSSALFGPDGLLAGTVGGGVVEGRVIAIASERYKTRTSCYKTFDLSNDISEKSEAICGGVISILIDADPDLRAFSGIQHPNDPGIPGVLLTVIKPVKTDEVTIERSWVTDFNELPSAWKGSENVEKLVSELLASPGPAEFKRLDINDQILILEAIRPPSQLVIAGAGHIGRALCHIGNMLGFEVTVIDDRPEFANRENLPQAHKIIASDIGKAVRDLSVDQNSYIVIVTRGHKDDAEALKACIGSDPAYIGMIGSRRKITAMKDEFIHEGYATTAQWDRIFTPIGIEINSRTVEEIAVSIAAQIILVKNSGRNKSRSCPA